jgi:hypothetical protein
MFNDAVPESVPNFSNVAAAVKWATKAKKRFGEILNDEEDDTQIE